MNVLNIHKRLISASHESVVGLFATLATKEDKVWPGKLWPRIRFKDGLKVGASGGHGPIRYDIISYEPSSLIAFRFTQPLGFNGIHQFEIWKIGNLETEIVHTIDIETSGLGTIKWVLAIKSLHNALIQDAFDKIENQLTGTQKKSDWNVWVRLLRAVLK